MDDPKNLCNTTRLVMIRHTMEDDPARTCSTNTRHTLGRMAL